MVSHSNIFVWKRSKIAAQKKVFFLLILRACFSEAVILRLVLDDFFRFGYSWSTLLWNRCYYPQRSRDALSPVCGIFSSFQKHQPSGPMLSISWNFRMCVCLSVCSLLRYCLTVFLPPLPEVGCPIFLEIQNPWGKVMERSGLTFEQFSLEVV